MLLTIFILLGLPAATAAQSDEIFTLSADKLQNGVAVELNAAGWKYHAGDDLSWANPSFDDANWETLKTSAMTRDSLPQTGWNGIGWLRLRLNIAPEMVNVPLNLAIRHTGASEVYLDGKLISGYGTVGRTLAEEETYNPNFVPLPITFNQNGEHLIAVRYSNQSAADVHSVLGALIKILRRASAFGANLARFRSTQTNVHNFHQDGGKFRLYSDDSTSRLSSIRYFASIVICFLPPAARQSFLRIVFVNDRDSESFSYSDKLQTWLSSLCWSRPSGLQFYLLISLKWILLLAFLYIAFEEQNSAPILDFCCRPYCLVFIAPHSFGHHFHSLWRFVFNAVAGRAF